MKAKYKILKVDSKIHDRLKKVCERESIGIQSLTDRLLDESLRRFEHGGATVQIVQR